MPTDLENLITRRSAILSELATGTADGETDIRRPSYNIDGQAVDWTAYRKSLLDELSQLNQAISALEGPVEISTEGQT